MAISICTILSHVSFKYNMKRINCIVANRLCMPQKSGTTFTPLSDALVDIDIFGQWVSDLKETFIIVGISLAVSLIIGFVYKLSIFY
jgi:hypothetical protein